MSLLVLNRRPLVDRIPGWLADADAELVLVTASSALAGRGRAEITGRFAEIVSVEDYDGPEVERHALDLAGRHAFDRVLSTTEVDLLRAARLRERLGLPGQTTHSARAYRDKYLMKSLVSAAGLAVAPMRRVGSAESLRRFAAETGFPLVVKPLDGGGSVGVRVLADGAALDRYLDTAPFGGGPPLLAEAWVRGDCYVVDGLMADGEVVQSRPLRMGHSNLSVVTESRHMTGWMLPRGDHVGERVREFAARVVAALPGPREVTAFHAEVFHTPQDELVLCEIAARPGGSGHAPCYERANGVSLYGAGLRGQAGLPPDPRSLAPEPERLTGFCWFTPRRGTLRALPEHCPLEGADHYVTTAAPGSVHDGARSVADHVARLLVSAPPGTDLAPRMRAAEAWWESNCRWDD
ncbi:hypothetical protein CIB93_20570 [Streptomyces sp. WZ.A104]|uniref:ATP-grasp domain-containing protein n=1 Tax=Streptomyces sp. WZ.A104 TaxID=2023771 RepID=UPI000BBBB5C4|nr:ATP-grasp domain-containing protein [Streptomyces sp. WZ.A104]PCG84212.1 hypothetical protein CIB93_20570 [Streptomyces sp. WZ.A104]